LTEPLSEPWILTTYLETPRVTKLNFDEEGTIFGKELFEKDSDIEQEFGILELWQLFALCPNISKPGKPRHP